MDEDKRKQEERERRYGIRIRPDGNVTIPSEHRRRWPGITPEDYLDPVNLKYPVPDAEQVRVAAAYWGRAENRAQYSREEQEIIDRRLEEAKKKFKVGEYAESANREDLELLQFELAQAARAPDWVQVLPAGRVESEKGTFLVDAESARLVMEAFRQRGRDLVIDYEHQTLSGAEAPAAGWIVELEDRGEQGIWARVRWTPRAESYLANREYRYLSPVVLVRKSDMRVVRIHSVALTNVPAIPGMVPVVNKDTRKEEDAVLEKLRAILGLAAGAGDEEVLAAVRQLKDRPEVVAHKEVLALLELPEAASLDQVKGKVLALKNPSGYVRVEEFQALKEKLAQRERDELVQAALSAGKIAPAQKSWAEQYAAKDPEGFRAFLEMAPQVVPVGGKPPADVGRQGPDEVQAMVNKLLGISDETFAKYGGETK